MTVVNKPILDACCGGRMFWFDKKNPNVLFADCRNEEVTFKDRDKLRELEIKPDVTHDFTNMPYPDKSFKGGNMETLTIKQVAKYLNLSEHTVRCHLSDWGFFRMPNSRVWRIHKSDLDLAKRRADNFPLDCSVGRNKKENLCRSTNEKKVPSGGLILLRQVGKELDALLKQK